MSHDAPLHPATVHFPIAFLTLHYALDILYGLTTHNATSGLVNSFYDVTPYLTDISKASYYMNMLGFLTAIPAVMSGGQQLVQMIKRQDLASKIKKSDVGTVANKMHPKMKLGFMHAALNDVGIIASGYTWYARRPVVAMLPGDAGVLLSAVLLPTLMFSSYLGGQMVYKYGVGVNTRKAD